MRSSVTVAPEAEEWLEGSNSCITDVEAFRTVCLDKYVLYTALVTMHTVRGSGVKITGENLNRISENNNQLRCLLG